MGCEDAVAVEQRHVHRVGDKPEVFANIWQQVSVVVDELLETAVGTFAVEPFLQQSCYGTLDCQHCRGIGTVDVVDAGCDVAVVVAQLPQPLPPLPGIVGETTSERCRQGIVGA